LNILITSAGTRGYLIKYFKESLRGRGKIFATDCSKYAPALYDADNFFILSRIDNNNYKEELLKICLVNNVKAVVSPNDKELPILAELKNDFKQEWVLRKESWINGEYHYIVMLAKIFEERI